MKQYKTLQKYGKGQQKIKNSLFISYARPVESETEAQAFVKEIKKLHKDANHNVSAYIVKKENFFVLKYDDDGEPAGSSGKPVFKMLESKELINAAVVVSRYFGGIKLGFGGISKAYRETALLAIEDAGITEIYAQTEFRILTEYQESQLVKSLIEEYGTLNNEKYTDKVEFLFSIKKDSENTFIEKTKAQTKNKITIERC